MGTNITYNSIELKNVLLRVFDQQPVRDESSTDRMFTRWTIDVETVIATASNAQYNSSTIGYTLFGGATAPHPTTAYDQIRGALNADRGRFIMTVDGQELISCSTSNDQDNGPKVTHFKLTQLTAATFRLNWGVTFCKTGCTSTADGALNNRWSLVDDIDQDHRTSRTIRGRLRARVGFSPQALRGLVIPSLPNGWRRKHIHIEAAPNGRELGYEIRDEELAGEAAPSPATQMSGIHSETIQMGAVLATGKVQLRLQGPRTADPLDLIVRAVQIVNKKLYIKKGTSLAILRSMTIARHILEDANVIEVLAEADHLSGNSTAKNVGAIVLPLLINKLELPEYDSKVTLAPSNFGTGDPSLATLFACYLQNPCGSHQIGSRSESPGSTGETTTTTSDGGDSGDGGGSTSEPSDTTITSGSGDTVPYDPVPYSEEHNRAVYRFFQIDSIYDEDEMRVALPIAKPASGDGDTVYIATLAAGNATRTVKLKAERLGDWPVMPKKADFTAGGIKHYIMKRRINARAPQLTADGENHIFAMDGEYVYALARQPKDAEMLCTGILPFDISVGEFSPVMQDKVMVEPGEIIGSGHGG